MAAKIVYLDDSDDLIRLLSRLIKFKLSEDCLGVHSMGELMSKSSEVLQSQLAILDINLGMGEPTGVDAYEWLRAHNFQGEIFFLTGHSRSDPLVAQACQTGASVWDKPIATNQIFTAIGDVIGKPANPI